MRTIIKFLATVFVIIGVASCEPQPEVNKEIVEELEQPTQNDGDIVTNPEQEDESPEIQEPPMIGGVTGPYEPFILQPEDVYEGVWSENCGNNIYGSGSVIAYSHFGFCFGFWGGTRNSNDLYESTTEFAIASKWCDENVEIVNSMVETFKKEDVEIYRYSSRFVYSTIEYIEITADKPLWGVEAGQNLVDKFYLYCIQSPLMFSYPECEYVGNIYEMNEPWYEVLQKCLWPNEITIRSIEPVESIYDVVNFNVKFHSPDHKIDYDHGWPVTFVPDDYDWGFN